LSSSELALSVPDQAKIATKYFLIKAGWFYCVRFL